MLGARHITAMTLALLAPAALPSAASADDFVTPLTPEFLANINESSLQGSPDVAMDPAGNFVVAWQSPGDGDTSGVFYRLYNAAGSPLTGELQANTTTAGFQGNPSVARTATGNFVIAWRTRSAATLNDVLARTFDANGTPVSAEIPVNTTTANEQDSPSIGIEADGDFAVTWASEAQDGNLDGVFMRRFNAAGTPTTGETAVNTTTTGNQNAPKLSMDPVGNFVVAFRGDNLDGASLGVAARRFLANGTASGEIDVNTTTASNQTSPDVALDPSGAFVVAWQSSAQDGDATGVFARRFDAANAPTTAEIPVNVHTAGFQEEAAVASDGDQDFTVTWGSNTNSNNAGDLIYARRFTSAGVPKTGEIPVSTTFVGIEHNSGLANTASGHFVPTWTRADSSSDGVAVRIFDVADAPPPTDGGGGDQPPSGGDTSPQPTPTGTDQSPPPPADGGGALKPGACANEKVGAGGRDALTGTDAGDVLRGLADNDTLRGLAGDDCLFGGVGDDRLDGGAGNDKLNGEQGKDNLSGGAGRDSLSGAAGNDKLTGGAGNDKLSGGAGNDTISGGAGKNSISAGAGNDKVTAANGTKETVNCGSGGADRVVADKKDKLRGCERVQRR